MKIIKLPAMLPGALDLAVVNQQLRDRTAQLDWSAVVSASEKPLAVLLAGLDLSNDADVLDCEDSALSDTIAEKVVQALQAAPKQTRTVSFGITAQVLIANVVFDVFRSADDDDRQKSGIGVDLNGR